MNLLLRSTGAIPIAEPTMTQDENSPGRWWGPPGAGGEGEAHLWGVWDLREARASPYQGAGFAPAPVMFHATTEAQSH